MDAPVGGGAAHAPHAAQLDGREASSLSSADVPQDPSVGAALPMERFSLDSEPSMEASRVGPGAGLAPVLAPVEASDGLPVRGGVAVAPDVSSAGPHARISGATGAFAAGSPVGIAGDEWWPRPSSPTTRCASPQYSGFSADEGVPFSDRSGRSAGSELDYSEGRSESDTGSLENAFYTERMADRLVGQSVPSSGPGSGRSSFSESVGATALPGGQAKRGRLRGLSRRIRNSVGGVGSSVAMALGADHENLEEVIQRGTLGEVGAQRQAAEILKQTAEHNPHRLMKGMDQLPWVETLIDFANSDDQRTQLLMSSTVLSLAEHEENRLNLVKAGLLQPLMYLRTNSTDSTTKTLATEALDKLGVYSHQSLLQLVTIQGMAPLRYLGGCGDVRAQRTAASVLASLLDDDEARLDIVRGDGFRTVLGLATSSDEYIQTIVSIAIANLPLANMDLVRLVQDGSLRGVVALMDSPKHEFRTFATTIVCNVVALESFHCADCSLYPVGSWHSAERFCIATECGNIDLCQQCAMLRGKAAMSQMQQITVATELRERVVAEGGHTALINVIKEGIVAVDSAHVRPSLEGDAASATALQAMAVRALASLALKSSHAAGINTSGGTAILVDLLIHFQYLSDGALAVLRNATRALANLACCARHGTWQGEAIARSILAARALQPLLVLTLHQDVEVVRHTARSLAELSSVKSAPDEYHQLAGTAGSSPNTCESDGGDLEASTPGSAHSVLSAGTGSAYSESSAGQSTGHGSSLEGVSTMSPHRNHRSVSTNMIRTRSGRSMQPQIILECDGVEWLCILASHEDWVVKCSAALIFERISSAAHAWLAHRAAGIIPAVVSLAEDANQMTRQHAKYALAALSKYEVFQSRIIMQSELRSMIAGRAEDGIPEKRLTSVIMRHLSASDACRRVLLEEDPSGFSVLKEVLALLALKDYDITMNLAYVISDMSLDEPNMPLLTRQEVVATVIEWGVSEDETLQLNAAVTLENLASYQPAKALLGSLGAVPVLINDLAASQSAETVRHAVAAMAHLSRQGPLDIPKAPDEASSAGEKDTMLKIIFAQAAKLVQVDSELTWETLTAAILEQCDLPTETTSADLALSYVDTDGHMMKITKQEELQKVARYHKQQQQAPGAMTLYLGLRDASRNNGRLGTSTAAESATKEDFEAFRKPIDSFVEIDEKELEFRDRIGVGACGEVFHGKWRGVDVAVKCLFTDGGARHSADGAAGGRVDMELLKDFRNEVRLMMQLRHPNICLFMGAVFRLETQRLCIVSEFCHRGSLYRILHKSERQLPTLRRCQIALDAAKGCQFLHTHKPCIVHRDLKSPNLLVDKHWNVKVGDFGLARTKSHFYVSLGGGNVGTPEWTAPEVLKDEQFTEKADVYSFGVVLWEICTRQRPFRGLTQMQVVVAVGFNGERLPRVSHWDNDSKKSSIDPEMSELMQNCMVDDWQARPSFANIVSQLTTICGRYQKREEQKAAARKGRNISAASEPAVVHKPASVVMAPAAVPATVEAKAAPAKASVVSGVAASGTSAKSGTTGTIINFLRRSGEEKDIQHEKPEPQTGVLEPEPEPQLQLQPENDV